MDHPIENDKPTSHPTKPAPTPTTVADDEQPKTQTINLLENISNTPPQPVAETANDSSSEDIHA